MNNRKRLISFLLIIFTCINLLTACTPTENSAESKIDNTSGTENITGIDYNKLLSVYKKEAVRGDTVVKESVTLGKSYSLSIAASEAYPDNGKKLTDGVYSENGTILTSPERGKYVGIEGESDFSVIIDLGGLTEGICDFEFSELRNAAKRYGVAENVDFYISSDGTDYTFVGSSVCSDTVTNNSEYVHFIKLQYTVEAAYIKAVVKGLTQKFSMVDEFAAYKYNTKEPEKEPASTEYYKNETFDTVVTSVYWNSNEEGYNTKQNLLSGKKARIFSTLTIEDAVRTDYYNTPTASANLLTNGLIGDEIDTNNQYFHFTQSYARDIIFDLEKTSTIDSFTLGCLSNKEYEIGIASRIIVNISENGVDWMGIYSEEYSSEVTSDRVELSGNFEHEYKARFVKFTIRLESSHCWVDEITLMGTKAISNTAKDVIPNNGTGVLINEYPNTDVLGAENILLTYTFKCENIQGGLNSKEELLPYVAYLDANGKILDTFFDGYLFLACSTVCPSGGVLYYDRSRPSNASDWIAYADNLFADGYNINALQETVSEVKTTLGNEDFIAKVYFPLYSTVPNQTDFGDIDGDGISEDLSKVENRKKVYKWWIDLLIERYTSAGFTDLDLVGFYWNEETIHGPSDAGEAEVMDFVDEYVHQLDYKYFWIPYFMSSGYANWQSYGFDAAFMQPNYMFKEDLPAIRVDNTAQTTKYLGMGVEIELDGQALNTVLGLERYRKYLSAGVTWGYMNSTKTYYQDGGPGILFSCYNSVSASIRSIYDDTYRYAKCTLSLEAPDVVNQVFETIAGETIAGTLAFAEKNYTIITAKAVLSPKFGILKVNNDGVFEYTPAAGFTGTDSFEITVSSGIGVRTVTITVNVK